ncbi:helix-turn-helix domain-containing protein [Croceitalea marina]|uniref:Helix-turn-helix domain-containing protein n=1 Tax=Croceitalea marina TaxID=1775166 RepID=A0ABW5MX16_9FLAO
MRRINGRPKITITQRTKNRKALFRVLPQPSYGFYTRLGKAVTAWVIYISNFPNPPKTIYLVVQAGFMATQFLAGFPQFNSYSTPLLILGLQGAILCVLLYRRYLKKRALPDILLAGILFILCYHRTTYTIGFMGWYDTYRNTKINYFLVGMDLLMAPLIYFYVKSVVTPKFKLLKKHFWHFLPWLLFFLAKAVIYGYDAQQPGFEDNQNGYLVENFQWPYLNPLVTFFGSAQMLLYLAFSFQLYLTYKEEIQQFFSNTANKELLWIRNFLLIYTAIFIYGLVQVFVDEYIVEMSWTQKWWIQFFSAIALLYFGVKGYFTDFNFLKDFEKPYNRTFMDSASTTKVLDRDLLEQKENIDTLFKEEKIFLDPELNLKQLAEKTNLNRGEVSEVINQGFGMNFNDFVNQFRITEFQQRLQSGAHEQFSLVGIAFECGFNSKATFNRVFKKAVKLTPTEYLNSIKN